MSPYQLYPAYKDSGVEWLGVVPEHWSVERISHRFQLRNGFPFDSAQFAPEGEKYNRLIRIRDLSPNNNLAYTAELCPKAGLISDGDVLIGMDGDFNAVLWNNGAAKLNQRVCALRGLSDAETKYLLYSLPGPLKIINDTAYSTTVKHLSSGEVLYTRLALPPEPELRTIVHHLDCETARIDGLVAKKTRFIELLREKRQALITHAVTKGLDPNVKMKDSGVEWLGKVPEHWEVTIAKYVTRTFVPQRNKPELNNAEDGTSWITMEDMKSERVSVSRLWVADQEAMNAGSKKLPRGSVIASCVGSFGVASINTIDVIINQQLQAYIPGKKIDAAYLRYCVSSMGGYFETIGTSSTIVYVNQQGFDNLPIALPVIEEQKEIVSFLDRETTRIDTLISKTQQSIELLKERRSALITAAVTGQIDLRETV